MAAGAWPPPFAGRSRCWACRAPSPPRPGVGREEIPEGARVAGIRVVRPDLREPRAVVEAGAAGLHDRVPPVAGCDHQRVLLVGRPQLAVVVFAGEGGDALLVDHEVFFGDQTHDARVVLDHGLALDLVQHDVEELTPPAP
jgi:hypothetical protein